MIKEEILVFYKSCDKKGENKKEKTKEKNLKNF
jgi:hypothetical protein